MSWRRAISKRDYTRADAWKQRTQASARAEKMARQAVKAALSAMKARGIQASSLTEKSRLANEEAALAASEAEKVWADTANDLR